MNITIVGGGNVGTQFAVHCAEKQNRVIMYSSKPERFCKHLSIVDSMGTVIHEGDIWDATSSAERAFADADIIFVTVPAFGMKAVANQVLPYIKKGVKIGLIPGTGAGEHVFGECINKGATIFGLQRVPSVARLVEYGKSVRAVGYRKELHIAALPYCNTESIRKIISDIFDMPCIALPNYLNLTLTPSNPILHTTRLRVIFRDYHEGAVYDSVPLFYEDWNDETSELLFKCDDEVQSICRGIKEFDLSYVKSLKLHYESDSPKALTKKIANIQGFKGLKTPTIEVDRKYIPDLHSRYFTADFPYGLEILVQIANLVNVSVPNMEEILKWYNGISLDNSRFLFSDFGISEKKQLCEFYML